MFILRRLFGRKDILDDAETAYVERRASPTEIARLRERLTGSPERMAELDSLRATVRVLRSVQSEMAPRSFALSESPAFARSGARRTAFAPAMAAIVAAIGVGLLAIGDLTGYVSQSSSGGDESAAFLSSEAATTQGAEGPDGSAGPAGVPAPTATEVTAGGGALTGSSEDTALAPSALATPTFSVDDLAPDSGYGITRDQYERLEATVEAAGGEESRLAATLESDPAEPSSAPGLAATGESSAKATGDGGESISLPLWQLQVSLAGLAALMIAAWAFIRRRATA